MRVTSFGAGRGRAGRHNRASGPLIIRERHALWLKHIAGRLAWKFKRGRDPASFLPFAVINWRRGVAVARRSTEFQLDREPMRSNEEFEMSATVFLCLPPVQPVSKIIRLKFRTDVTKIVRGRGGEERATLWWRSLEKQRKKEREAWIR